MFNNCFVAFIWYYVKNPMAFSHYIVSTIAHFCTLLALNFELWVNFGWAHPDLVSELCITVYVKVTTNTYCCCWHSCVHHCYHHIVSSHHTADMLEYTFHYWHIGTHYFHTLYTVHTYNVGYNKHCIQRGRYWEAGVIDRTKLVPPKKNRAQKWENCAEFLLHKMRC